MRSIHLYHFSVFCTDKSWRSNWTTLHLNIWRIWRYNVGLIQFFNDHPRYHYFSDKLSNIQQWRDAINNHVLSKQISIKVENICTIISTTSVYRAAPYKYIYWSYGDQFYDFNVILKQLLLYVIHDKCQTVLHAWWV